MGATLLCPWLQTVATKTSEMVSRAQEARGFMITCWGKIVQSHVNVTNIDQIVDNQIGQFTFFLNTQMITLNNLFPFDEVTKPIIAIRLPVFLHSPQQLPSGITTSKPSGHTGTGVQKQIHNKLMAMISWALCILKMVNCLCSLSYFSWDVILFALRIAHSFDLYMFKMIHYIMVNLWCHTDATTKNIIYIV